MLSSFHEFTKKTRIIHFNSVIRVRVATPTVPATDARVVTVELRQQNLAVFVRSLFVDYFII
jgi:hypothetical protein